MKASDWINLVQALALSGIGIFFTVRLEKIRKLYARNLKRYDLLHTARFNALEAADDCLVRVQQAQFEAWRILQGEGSRSDYIRERTDDLVEHLHDAIVASAIAKVKCEKYFEGGFNAEFAELMSKLQHSEMCIRDVRDIRSVANAAQLRSEKDSKMNASLIISKEAIPAFRKRMGELIQQDVGE
ncbi:MAG: hypothetical protein K8H89_05720 [Flavobacteriales bacterium]|nr:hypothetical protein [Flavobacteriales bacterium]